MRSIEAVIPLLAHSFNLTTHHHRAQGKSIAKCFAQCDYVWNDIFMVDREQITTAPNSCLRFVNDKQHASLLAVLFECLEVPRRQDMHTRRTLDTLNDTRSQTSTRLTVDQIPPVVQLSLPIIAPILNAKDAAVAVGRGKHEHTRHQWALTFTPEVVLCTQRLGCDTMPGGAQADDLEVPCEYFGELYGRFV